MSILIVFTSRHGCTQEAASMLQEKIISEVQLIDLKENSKPDLAPFDTIIVGGSIHAGKVQSKVKNFCQANMETLKTKKIGLFLCCMEEGEKAQAQFDNAFPESLRKHAAAKGLFGGAFYFERMNFIERFIIKKIAKISESVNKMKPDEIKAFAEKIVS